MIASDKSMSFLAPWRFIVSRGASGFRARLLVFLELMSLNVGENLVNKAKCLLQTGRRNTIWADAEEKLLNLTLKCSYFPSDNGSIPLCLSLQTRKWPAAQAFESWPID